MSESASETNAPSNDRLVIRITLDSYEPEPPPPAPRWNKGAIAVTVGVVAVLGWFGIGSLRSDPPPPPAVAENTPVAAPIAAVPTPAAAVEPEAPQQPDAPPSAINEVLPDVPQSALDTIRGTIRVVIRVSIDKQGSVVAATAEERGPSRYFERLSVDASKQWTFTPAASEDQRTMLIRFNFTRYGATAQLS